MLLNYVMPQHFNYENAKRYQIIPLLVWFKDSSPPDRLTVIVRGNLTHLKKLQRHTFTFSVVAGEHTVEARIVTNDTKQLRDAFNGLREVVDTVGIARGDLGYLDVAYIKRPGEDEYLIEGRMENPYWERHR